MVAGDIRCFGSDGAKQAGNNFVAMGKKRHGKVRNMEFYTDGRARRAPGHPHNPGGFPAILPISACSFSVCSVP